MSIFKGSLGSKRQEHHSFVSQDQFLVNINMNSFTLRSCQSLYKQNRKLLKNNSLFDPMPQTINEEQTILDIASSVTCQYTEFNNATLQYNAPTSITYTELKNLIKYHEDRIFNTTNENEIYDKQIKDIKNSLEKSVVCKFDLFNFAASDTANYPDGKFKINLTFQDRGNRSNERSVAFQNIQIAAPPKTPTGETYSFRETNDYQTSATNNINSFLPGSNSSLDSKSSQSEKSNTFGQDAVAGQLDIWYDSNTGKWKSGTTQVLSRLITDIDPAELESIADIPLTSTDVNDLLQKTSKFTIGSGILLSMQNGNPHTLGPSFKQCVDKKVIEVRVVNRSRKSFKKDETVILTEINGEWIPQPFGEDQALVSPIRFGDWAFFKFITNSDTYFKDFRYADPSTDNAYVFDVKASQYEQQARQRFYENILDTWIDSKDFTHEDDSKTRLGLSKIYGGKLKTIRSLNYSSTVAETNIFAPSKRFYIASIFDQLKTDVGGFSSINLVDAVNNLDELSFVDSINPNFKNAEPMLSFWGPVYSEGFKTLAYNPNGRNNTENKAKFFGPIAQNPDINSFPPMADDVPKERRLLNIPAEVGSIFINPLSIFEQWQNLGKTNFLIENQYIHSPYYGTSEPVSKNQIQFSPLYAELVIEGVFYIDLFFKTYRETKFQNQSLLGNLFPRSSRFGFFDIFDVPESKRNKVAYYDSPNSMNINRKPFSLAGMPVKTYEPWESYFDTTAPQGAFCVGVISAKQTISKGGGGTINLSTNQAFGRNARLSVTGGGFNNSIGVLPGGIIIGNAGAAPTSATNFPTWGSRSDNIGSFGTTALHARIFDYWPPEQTIFDPRYFGVLHFNAGSYYNNATLSKIDGETPENIKKRVDAAKALDIPIPTYIDEKIVTENDIINENTKFLPKNKWKLNPIRRGALLSSGGFTYLYHVIGVGQYEILFGGTGFNNNFEYSVTSKNLIINFTVSNGKIIAPFKYKKDSLDNELIGDSFLPEDFNSSKMPIINNEGNITGYYDDRAYILAIPSQTPNGKPAIISFTDGVVWLKKAKDDAPVEQVPVTRLSLSSAAGQNGYIKGGKENTFQLVKNSSSRYDCFYHFHNDVSHTLGLSKYGAGMGSYLQFINLTIS
jgi:hypothetical protein